MNTLDVGCKAREGRGRRGELGFSSLFEYCVEALRLYESTAGRHIAAARVGRNHPQVFALVASGALHASALSLMKKHLTNENAQELFVLCRRKSARKVEELLAARFPKPDVRDLVRRLPTPARSHNRCLELDHIDPRAEGGPDTVRNLRLRCRAHNQWYARQYFGRAHIGAAVKRSRLARIARSPLLGCDRVNT